MTGRDDLIALRDAVQLGPVSAHTASKCFPNGYAHIVNASAYPGSVDAALAFFAAVLPGWTVGNIQRFESGTWYVKLYKPMSDWPKWTPYPEVEAKAETPALALIIATLNALIGEAE